MGKGSEGPNYIHLEAKSMADMEVVEEFKAEKVEVKEEVSPPEDPPVAPAPLENSAPSEKEEESEVVFENPTYENGDTEESTVSQVPKDEGPAEPEKADDGIDRRRLYFVRMPKPPEQSPATAAIQQELDHLNTQIKLLDLNLKVQRDEKARQRESVLAAQQDVAKSKAQLDAIDEKLRPLIDLRKAKRTEQDSMKATFGDLGVRTEAELKEKIKDLNFQFHHETNSLARENKLMSEIKRLEGLTDRVKEYEAKSAALNTAREEIKKHEDETKALEAERKAAYEDLTLQRAIAKKFKEEEQALDVKMNGVKAERARIKALSDATYSRLVAAKTEFKSKNDAYYENRRFGVKIRELCKSGKVDEARALCDEQITAMNARLANDDDFRKQYSMLWEQQRTYSVYLPAAEVEEQTNPKLNAAAKVEVVDPSGKMPRQPPSKEAIARAQAIVDAALSAAKVEVPRAEEADAPENVADTTAGDAVVAATPAPVVLADVPEKPKPVKQVKKEKPKAQPAPAIIPEIEFQLPEAISKGSASEASTEEKKAVEKARQLALAKEAEAKKERKKKAAEKAAEKKKQKALEKAAAPVAPTLPPPPPQAPEPVEVPHVAEEQQAPVVTKREVSKPSAVKGPAKPKVRPGKKKDIWWTLKQYKLHILIVVVALLIAGFGTWSWLARPPAVTSA
eukprot:jgi/Botrbrau1/17672/Bobra.0166s0098.2